MDKLESMSTASFHIWRAKLATADENARRPADRIHQPRRHQGCSWRYSDGTWTGIGADAHCWNRR